MEGVNPPQNNDENISTNESFFPFNFLRRSSILGPLIAFSDFSSGLGNNRDRTSGNNGFSSRPNIRIISSTSSNFNIVRNPEYAPQPTINSDEIRETIAQNLLEVQNIIEYGNYNEFINEEKDEKIKNDFNKIENEEKNEKEIKIDYNLKCFDLDKRIYIRKSSTNFNSAY